MTSTIDRDDHDLTIARVIRAPRAAVWRAWTDPRAFERWWMPAPYSCRVIEMKIAPGGAFVTQMSEDGRSFTPHLDACFLAVEEGARIVFTNTMSAGWRPAARVYPVPMTAIITLSDHPDGTEYAARVLHGTPDDRATHAEMGFYDGWGTTIGQLAALVEA